MSQVVCQGERTSKTVRPPPDSPIHCAARLNSPQNPPTFPNISAISRGSISVISSSEFVSWATSIDSQAYGCTTSATLSFWRGQGHERRIWLRTEPSTLFSFSCWERDFPRFTEAAAGGGARLGLNRVAKENCYSANPFRTAPAFWAETTCIRK